MEPPFDLLLRRIDRGIHTSKNVQNYNKNSLFMFFSCLLLANIFTYIYIITGAATWRRIFAYKYKQNTVNNEKF